MMISCKNDQIELQMIGSYMELHVIATSMVTYNKISFNIYTYHMKIHICLHIGLLAFIVQCQWLPKQALQVSFVNELYLTHYRTTRNLWCGPYSIWKSLEFFY